MPDKPYPMDEMDDLGLELTSSERMHRMKKLMRQLYQEEEAVSTVKLPPIKSKSLIVILSVSAIVVLIVTTFYNFNRFIAAEEQVLSSRGHIHDALQRRSNLFGNLVNLTLNHAMLEQEVFRYVSDGRIGLMGQQLPNTLSNLLPPAGTPPAEALSRLFGLVEQYPDIKTSTTYQQLMDKLMDIENLISKRRDEYNTEVKVYNTMVTSFPWWVMAKIMGFKRYPYFTAEPGPDNMNMELDANKFMRLIPEMEFGKTPHKESHSTGSQGEAHPGKDAPHLEKWGNPLGMPHPPGVEPPKVEPPAPAKEPVKTPGPASAVKTPGPASAVKTPEPAAAVKTPEPAAAVKTPEPASAVKTPEPAPATQPLAALAKPAESAPAMAEVPGTPWPAPSPVAEMPASETGVRQTEPPLAIEADKP
ncbi:MAG: LemA family protein [Magnetococcales bacterium]|nr:LemA family protein [Magnetococcales bacterium]